MTPMIAYRVAPPLTDELLATYRKAIDALPSDSPYKVALDNCWKCCKTWWELPEPEGTQRNAQPWGEIVAMHDDHKKALWDLIPWEHELDSLAGAPEGRLGLFDEIEADANIRNAERGQQWNMAVIKHVISTFYPDDPNEYDRIWAAIHAEAKWINTVSNTTKMDYEAKKKKAQECCDSIVKSVNSKNYPAIPRPKMEPTPLRDAAMHLIWHVRELNRDREPLTLDKIKKS